MRNTILILFVFASSGLSAHSDSTKCKRVSQVNKSRFFFHWGYNRGWYTKSDIHFKGNNYDFTLHNAVAKDRPTPFQWGDYLAIQNLTIPQTNLKMGYFISENLAVSFGVDHMKYVMQTYRYSRMSGTINNGGLHDGTFDNYNKFLDGGFVLLEHTDGLNYINLEVDRYTRLLNWRTLNTPFKLENNSGFGIGFLLPKTNATLFRSRHRDDFNIAGYGVNAKTGIKLSIGKYFYLQSEFKGGFINMPNIRISSDKSEGAKQNFLFSQFNWLLGVNI